MAWWFMWNGDLNLHFGSSPFFMDIKGRKGKKKDVLAGNICLKLVCYGLAAFLSTVNDKHK
jgi:hypothetical protein